MRRVINIIILYFAILLLLFNGCARVEETLYLRHADVSGSLPHTPVHLTDSSEIPVVTISPRFSMSTKNNFTGDVEQYSPYYSLDTGFIPSASSLNWDIAEVSAGVDMNIAVTTGFAITIGINYSSQKNLNIVGGNFGIGLGGHNVESAFRIDLGFKIHSMRYDAFTLVHRITTQFFGDKEEYVGFYHDVGKSTHFDPYINLTFNTAYKDWALNFFINAGYTLHTLFSFKPKISYYALGSYTRTDLRGSSTAGFINITPGIYFNLGESSRILVGSRFYIETLISNSEPKLFILPMVQFDVIL